MMGRPLKDNEEYPRVRRTLYLSNAVFNLLKKEADIKHITLSDHITAILKRTKKWYPKQKTSEKLRQVEVKLAFSVIADQKAESQYHERTYSNQIAGVLRWYVFKKEHKK